MSSRWSKTAYPFTLEADEGLVHAFSNRVLRSHDGSIDYTLTRTGWEVRKESITGGALGEGERTVVQVARDSESTDAVLQLTAQALSSAWFSTPDITARLHEQLATAERTKEQSRLP